MGKSKKQGGGGGGIKTEKRPGEKGKDAGT